MKRPNGPGQGMVAAAVDSPTSARRQGRDVLADIGRARTGRRGRDVVDGFTAGPG